MVADKEEKDGLYRAVIVDGNIVGMVSLEKKSDVYEKDYNQVEKIMKQVQEMHTEWRPDIYKN